MSHIEAKFNDNYEAGMTTDWKLRWEGKAFKEHLLDASQSLIPRRKREDNVVSKIFILCVILIASSYVLFLHLDSSPQELIVGTAYKPTFQNWIDPAFKEHQVDHYMDWDAAQKINPNLTNHEDDLVSYLIPDGLLSIDHIISSHFIAWAVDEHSNNAEILRKILWVKAPDREEKSVVSHEVKWDSLKKWKGIDPKKGGELSDKVKKSYLNSARGNLRLGHSGIKSEIKEHSNLVFVERNIDGVITYDLDNRTYHLLTKLKAAHDGGELVGKTRPHLHTQEAYKPMVVNNGSTNSSRLVDQCTEAFKKYYSDHYGKIDNYTANEDCCIITSGSICNAKYPFQEGPKPFCIDPQMLNKDEDGNWPNMTKCEKEQKGKINKPKDDSHYSGCSVAGEGSQSVFAIPWKRINSVHMRLMEAVFGIGFQKTHSFDA